MQKPQSANDESQNRRDFNGVLVSLIEAAKLKANPLALMLFDIDHLNVVNEACGQEAGDQLLQTLTARVKASIRSADILWRLTSDEFAIMMPDTLLDVAAKVAERVRAGIQSEAFRLGADKLPVPVTISIGLAQSVGGSPDVLQRAQKALRLSKQAGRNRVVIDGGATTGTVGSIGTIAGRELASSATGRMSTIKRKMAAIMAADVAFYSQLVADNEEETLRLLTSYRQVFDDIVYRYGGRVFNTAGDSVMSEFCSAVDAVRAAIDIQDALRTRNVAYPLQKWLQFRIGITVADVVEHHGELLGDGVNLAARLEGLAEPGGICISRAVHEAVANRISVDFRDIGHQTVKNMRVPVHAFMLNAAASAQKDDPLYE